MPLDRVDSFFDKAAIQAEIDAIRGGLADVKSEFTGLYETIKSFKNTSISTLAANTDQLSTAINGSVQSVTKAKMGYDELTQKITAQVKAVNESITSITENSEAYDQLIKQAVKNKIANDELAASANALKKAYQGGQTSLYQYQQSLADIKEAQVSLKTSNADVTRALNNMEKQAQSSSGSLDQLRAKLGELNMAYDKLSETERGSTQGQGLLKTIQTTDQALKQLEGSTGRFQRNVGNYAESLNPAFDSVKEQLQSINKELAAMEARGKASAQNVGNTIGFKTAAQRQAEGLSGQAAAGPTNLAGGSSQVTILNQEAEAYQRLTLQGKVLEGALERQTIGFKTANQEMRSVRNTLDTMALAGLEGTEAFEKLSNAYTENEQKVKDLHREQAILTGDTPGITALTGVARGLGGAYAFGAGAAQLLATGDQKLDKELNHLVAIMTLLQGLEEAASVLKQKNAIGSAIETLATKALNTVKEIEASIFKKSKVAQEADAAAKELNVAATEESTVATVANVEATEAQVVATEAAEAATIGLNTALVATGVGAIIVGVAVLVAKIIEWSEAENKAAENSAALAEAMEKVNEILETRIKLSDEDAEHTKKNLENALMLSEKNKQNYYEEYSVKKAQADLDQKIAENDLKKAANTEDIGAAYRSVEGEIKKLTTGMDPLLTKQQRLVDISNIWLLVQQKKINSSEAYFQIYQKYGTSTDESDAKTQLDAVQKEITANQTVIDAKKKMRDAYDQSQINQGALAIEKIQFAAEEERKLALETANIEVQAVKDRNARILALETSGRAQQLAALKSNRNAEIRAAQAEFENVKQDPLTTPAGLLMAQKELNSKRLKANEDYHNEVTDRNRKFYEQDRDANLETLKTELQDRINADQDIEKGVNQNNPDPMHPQKKAELSVRLNALSDEYAARRDIIAAERQKELDAERIDGTESLALTEDKQAKIKEINAKYTSQIIELNKTQQKTYLDLEAEARDESIKQWELYYSKRKEQIDENLDQHLVSLNMSHEGNKNYNRDRTKLEDQGAVTSAQNDAEKAEADRNSTKEGTQARVDADDKLTKSAEALSEAKRKQEQDQQEQTKKQVEEDLQNLQTVGNAGIEIEEIGYNRQVIDLQNLEKREARAFELQTKQIQDSSASQEQKSLRMKILDDQQAAQTEKNARKQRQLDIEKAKYDKAKAIMDIILNTAVAVTKALDDPFLEAAIIIAGAAELATAIATPLPKYKQGAGVAGHPAHKGGLGVVGDAFVPELIAEPGKAPFWSPAVPTVLDMAPGARIYPPEEINRMISSGMFVNQFGIIQQKETNRDMMEIKQAIVWQTGRIERALAKNKPKVVNNIKLDAKFGNHIHKSVFQ
jgi:hypothetical protein